MSELRSRVLGTLTVLLTIAGVSLVLIPAFVIRPFRYHSARALSLAIQIKWIAPALTVIACMAVLERIPGRCTRFRSAIHPPCLFVETRLAASPVCARHTAPGIATVNPL